MDKIIIQGGVSLSGAIEISGAKNACLTLMPAALLTDAPLTLDNVPALADITTMRQLLESLGTTVESEKEGRTLRLTASETGKVLAHYDIVRKMRASILVLGPLLARQGHAQVSLPGGCAIGARPVNLHLEGLQAMGAEIDLRDGYVFATAPKGLRGARYRTPFVSVGATENLMMAATLANGETVLENAAMEPEIIDLADCLRAMGARITGDGTPTIRIQGVSSLQAARHRVLVDRIELGTYMIAPAITGGSIELIGGNRQLVGALIEKLEAADVAIEDTPRGLLARRKNGVIHPVYVRTEPFPGFPTDLQAQLMALMTLADGVSRIEESIFENRFMHVPELMRFGAKIDVHGHTATVTGIQRLRGAPVMATDLRASVSLVLAALAAEGESVINRVYHLDRGYERVEQKLSACGAKIWRVRE